MSQHRVSFLERVDVSSGGPVSHILVPLAVPILYHGQKVNCDPASLYSVATSKPHGIVVPRVGSGATKPDSVGSPRQGAQGILASKHQHVLRIGQCMGCVGAPRTFQSFFFFWLPFLLKRGIVLSCKPYLIAKRSEKNKVEKPSGKQLEKTLSPEAKPMGQRLTIAECGETLFGPSVSGTAVYGLLKLGFSVHLSSLSVCITSRLTLILHGSRYRLTQDKSHT